MSNLLSFSLAAFSAVLLLAVLWQWYMKRAVVKHVNRRLVAYEGKLRNLGHEPDKVYHDFENMLESNVDDRQAEEFDSNVERSNNDD